VGKREGQATLMMAETIKALAKCATVDVPKAPIEPFVRRWPILAMRMTATN